jgi:hypothetical protein
MPAKGPFKLDVTLDASGIADRSPGHPLKVIAYRGADPVGSAVAKLDEKGKAVASLLFEEHPGAVRVAVGPADAADEQLVAMQTLGVDVPARRWGETSAHAFTLAIPLYYWRWWRTWCRKFAIQGRVLCANGQPVPGATVTAFDVDFWWWWTSHRQVARAITDVHGTFTMSFTWCCGFWPWWWWRARRWQIEPSLAARIGAALRFEPRIRELPKPSPEPDLAIFTHLLEARDSAPALAKGRIDPADLASLREALVKRLPEIPEAAKLRLWPWFPWAPWWDCTPDILFNATQTCGGVSTTIVEGGLADVHWDIPADFTVTLFANDKACCVAQSSRCTMDTVCGDLPYLIGGNLGSESGPTGYLLRDEHLQYRDRPYASSIDVAGEVSDGDYYAVEWCHEADDPTVEASWQPMPDTALGIIERQYFTPPSNWHQEPFAPHTVDGLTVYETRAHYEATHPPRVWGGSEDNLVVPWQTTATISGGPPTPLFPDGTYRLRVASYDLDAQGHLINKRVQPVCPGAEGDASTFVILRVDNQQTLPGPNDDHGKPCGGVHACTDEPDTNIVSVKFNGNEVRPCEILDVRGLSAAAPAALEITFTAQDAEGHLDGYTLDTYWGEDQTASVLAEAAPVSAISTVQPGPTYADALTQGASRPVWKGGTYKVTIPDLRHSTSFPTSCAYLLDLRASKRTIVSCDHQYTQTNRSTTTFTVLK